MIPVLYTGSVKDIRGPITAPDGERLIFEFSDAYSVFDWGRMPDAIPHKGEALCITAAHFFETLEARGIRTHYLGVLEGESTEPKNLKACSAAPRRLMVKAADSARPKLNRGSESKLRFVPLEVIFRFGFPAGSSALGRIPGAAAGARLPEPLIEFSTKLEDQDRMLSDREAASVAGISDAELDQLKSHAAKIARVIESELKRVGIVLWDGKVEFARDPNWVLVDSIGPDELRLARDGVELSKEVLRAHYRKTTWFKQLSDAKKTHAADWRKAIPNPPNLPQDLIRSVAALYADLANHLTSRKWWAA